MIFLLDSNILIRFFKKEQAAIAIIAKAQSQGLLAVSVLTVSEMCAGWNIKQAENMLPTLYKLVRPELVTIPIAEYSGHLRKQYRTQGKQLATVDAVIAATAILKHYMLVTFDTDFYPIAEVQFYT